MAKTDRVENDKKFVRKVVTKGGVERDVFAKRYEKYVWGILNNKIDTEGVFPDFLKDDVFQYVFIKLFESDCRALKAYLENYNIPFKSYLSIYVPSRVIDYLRKENKIQAREVGIGDEEEDEHPDEALSPEKHAVFQDFIGLMDKFSEGLPEKDQDTFRLMCEGSSRQEIAERTGLKIQAVYKKVYHLKVEFKKFLEENS